MERCVVYTAITGMVDRLMRPTCVDGKNLTYVCYSDSPLLQLLGGPSNWEVRRMETSRLDDVRRAKEYKLLPHRYFPDYDVSIWIDGNIDVVGDLQPLVRTSELERFLAFRHPERDCAYAEAEECIRLGKDAEAIIRRQMDRYRVEGLPARSGLIEANVLIRRHNDPQVIELMEAWWREILAGSRRDQLSFPYVAWKSGFVYRTLGDQSARGTSPCFQARWDRRHVRETSSGILRSYFERKVLWRLPKRRISNGKRTNQVGPSLGSSD
jgi:hypothetical protein